MRPEAKSPRNWFGHGGRPYAMFRPEYPLGLARFLAEIAPARRRAVDVGCGTGQLTAQLATHFDEVVGLDSSVAQIANAPACPGAHYFCAAAEGLPLPAGCASLITAAQAAHWFDLPMFYAEVRRIAERDAVIALISYGVIRFEGELQERFERFYRNEIAPYWLRVHKHVDTGYRDVSFPFAERDAPGMEICRAWELGDFLGYISTWTAVHRLLDAGREQILVTFVREISELWGAPTRRWPVSWPINMRIGTV